MKVLNLSSNNHLLMIKTYFQDLQEEQQLLHEEKKKGHMKESNLKEMILMKEAQHIEHKVKFPSFGIVILLLKLLMLPQSIVSKIQVTFYIRVQARV